MKFYIRKEELPSKKVHMYKVYDKMPEDIPEVFRKSRLIAFDEVTVEKSLDGRVTADIKRHSMTDGESLKNYLKDFEEIDEQTYETLREGAQSIIENTNSLLRGVGFVIKRN